MKKVLVIITLMISGTQLFAQESKTNWLTNITDKCFCCDNNLYQLPNFPTIIGVAEICKGKENIFSVGSCDGANYKWTISPANITFSGQGTSQIEITDNTIYNNTLLSAISISVEISCGKKIVKNTLKTKICKSNDCGTWGDIYYWAIGEAANAHTLDASNIIYQSCNSGVYFSHSFTCLNNTCSPSILVNYVLSANCCQQISNSGYSSNFEGQVILTASCCGQVCSIKTFNIKIKPCGSKVQAGSNLKVIIGEGKNRKEFDKID